MSPYYSREDHKDWCIDNNYGVNNFGLDPTHIPLSKMRHDIGLHIPCTIARKMLHCFQQHVERHNDNRKLHASFEDLWGNTFYSNQFKNGEICSRINGGHVIF